MKIETIKTENGLVFRLSCDYSDRNIPKSFYWSWNSSLKVWETDREDFLNNLLLNYFDEINIDELTKKIYFDFELKVKAKIWECYEKKEKLPIWTLSAIGFYDKSGRFYLDDIYETTTSKGIRTPSRNWSKSVLKHTLTKKYVKALIEEKPDFAREVKLAYFNYEQSISDLSLAS
jgi:hypothetical protein